MWPVDELRFYFIVSATTRAALVLPADAMDSISDSIEKLGRVMMTAAPA